MSKWLDSIEEKGSQDAEKRALSAVDSILEKKAERKASSSSAQAWWLGWLLPTAGAAALILALWVYPRFASNPIEEMAAENQGELLEIAMDFRLIRDLQAVEQMEFLEKVGEPEEWHKKKKKKS